MLHHDPLSQSDPRARYRPAASAPLVTLLLGALAQVGAAEPGWHFSDVTAGSGITTAYRIDALKKPIEPRWICAGAAAADMDGDGFVDLYLAGGEQGSDVVLRNRGDGTFEDVTGNSGVELSGRLACGPVFADIDADGKPDLVVPSVHGAPEQVGQPVVDIPAAYTRVFLNLGNHRFAMHPANAGFDSPAPAYGMAFADLDGDGDLDAVATRWRFNPAPLVWVNQQGTFVDATIQWLGPAADDLFRYGFTPTLADFDADGRPDLALAGDFGNSRIFRNLDGISFVDRTDPAVVTDENGMGGAVGDVDGDGRLDWLVTSIWDPDGIPEANWGTTGNRLYLQGPDFSFTDATEQAGVREGYWGWGACLEDFDNDGDLDAFHVNGFPAPEAGEFHDDPARMFLNDGSGRFTEVSAALGVDHPGQGRGVLCFDLERDGDVDIIIINNEAPPVVLQNQLEDGRGWLSIRLEHTAPNTAGIGARIEVTGPERLHVREIRAGGAFVANGPAEAHFGFGDGVESISTLEVRWPSGGRTAMGATPINRRLTIDSDLIRREDFETAGFSAAP